MATKNQMQLYEGMYVLSSTLSEDARAKALERIETGIVERGGEVHKVHDQGRKKLAYEIEKKRDGYYFLLYFSLPAREVSELWKEYHLNEDLLRFITLTTDKVLEKIEFPEIIDGGKIK